MFRQGLSTPGVKKGACRFDKTWEVKKKKESLWQLELPMHPVVPRFSSR